MPANRSRTDRWRQSLQNIYQRGGGLEFAVRRDDQQSGIKDLVWRVRVLDLTEDTITIEQPGAMGQSFNIQKGVELVGIMSVGQNKWMFETTVIDTTFNQTRSGTFPALKISMPEKVVRCMRRHADRTSIAHIDLPTVECWKLLEPLSAVPVEVANRVQIEELVKSGQTKDAVDDQMALPQVGTQVHGSLSQPRWWGCWPHRASRITPSD